MYRIILVPVDGSPAASAGLDEAIRIAVHVGARLHLMNVVDDMAFPDEGNGIEDALASNLRNVVIEQGDKVLRRAKARAEQAGVTAEVALVRSGGERLLALVAREAETSGAELIVVGTHGQRGLSRVFMSTNAEHLLNVAKVPVLLVRSEDLGPGVSVVEISAGDSMFAAAP